MGQFSPYLPTFGQDMQQGQRFKKQKNIHKNPQNQTKQPPQTKASKQFQNPPPKPPAQAVCLSISCNVHQTTGSQYG